MRVSLKGTNIALLESTREYVYRKIVRMTEKLLVRECEAISLEIEEKRQGGKTCLNLLITFRVILH